MLRFIIRRFGFICLTLLIASIIIFFATQVLPGDVANSILGRYASEGAKEALREEMGLNRPLLVQYGDWLFSFVQGDWGTSLNTDYEVFDLVMSRLSKSAMLAAVGFMMFVPLGILLGLLAALHKNKLFDHVTSISTLAFIGLPEFVTGIILISIFSMGLDVLPASSAISPREGFIEAFPHLILPGITIALVSLAYVTRMTRSSTIEVLNTDYIRAAHLKGLNPRQVLFGHVLRNSLLPTVTVVAMGIGWLIGGLIVTESLFSYPGLGRLLLYSIQRRDLPLIQASTMLLVAVFSLANLLADITYAILNPRIRYQ